MSATMDGAKTMKYILMMSVQKGPYAINSWPKDDIQKHIAFMIALSKDLRASGEFVAGEGLASPDEAKLVRAGKDGLPVTDGVFPESKEFLAGYWIVEVPTAQRAYEIAARASAAPGPASVAPEHADRSQRSHERTASRVLMTARPEGVPSEQLLA